MNPSLVVGQRQERVALGTLETLTVALLAAMIPVWLVFQVVEIQALFPPIGMLYAVGSAVVAGVILLGRKRWGPALAAAWGTAMMIPEGIPAIDHLLHWDDLHGHFAHYLLIMTFFPLAVTLVATGIAATVQNDRGTSPARLHSGRLRKVLLGLVTLILVANAVTIALYALDIP
jgi:hypothetical protein